MNIQALLQLLETEKDFFAGLADIKEVVLYGSALSEDDIRHDIDLLLVPSREMSEGEMIDLRQEVWTKFKDRVPVVLDVQVSNDRLNKVVLSGNGVELKPIYTR